MPPPGEQGTPKNAPILCHIRTPYLSGSGLVGTVQTRLNATLANVRQLLESLAGLARQGSSGAKPVGSSEAPVNVQPEEIRKIMTYTLHPFDLSADFSFVRGGRFTEVPRELEEKVQLVDIFPLLPPLWKEEEKQLVHWAMDPAAPLVKVLVRREGEEFCSNAVAVLFVSMQQKNKTMEDCGCLERSTLDASLSGMSNQLNTFMKTLNPWNCNVRDCFGRTVLHEYVYQGCKEVVAHLLSLPFIHPNEQDAQGLTPLHIAVKKRDGSVVSQLLDRGVDVFIPDTHGDTPLHTALRLRDEQIVELLCQHLRDGGVDVHKLGQYTNKCGHSPVDVFRLRWPAFSKLCTTGDVRTMRSLYNHYMFDCNSPFELDNLLAQSTLHLAASAGHVEVMKFLLDDVGMARSIEKFVLNNRSQTPLHLAAERGHFEAVKFLHQRYPQWLGMQDVSGATPLIAVLRARGRWGTAIAEYLITNDSRENIMPDACDNMGNGALHLLCELGLIHLVRIFVENHRADVHHAHVHTLKNEGYLKVTRKVAQLVKKTNYALSRKGKRVQPHLTPIIYAIRSIHCRMDIIELLLSYGAGTRDGEVVEVLFYLTVNQYYDLAQRLLEASNLKPIQHNELICRLCEVKHSVAIRWCVKQECCQLNIPGLKRNPLVLSAKLGDVDAVTILLEHGADPNIGENIHRTPLALAINGQHSAVVGCLVRAGAYLLSPDCSWSALRAAVTVGAESVVFGLLGTPTMPPSEVCQALVLALQEFRGRNTARCDRLCVHLARALSLTADNHVHPIELLHLLASRACFDAVRVLVDKLLAMPRDELDKVLQSAPPPPSLPFVLIEPTEVPPPKGVCGRVCKLHPPPVPFKRLSTRRADRDILWHRARFRDVFSYCASAREVKLIECLLFDVGLKPWEGPDLRGWNAADYAVASKSYDSVRMLLVAGLGPLRRHLSEHGATSLATVCRCIAAGATATSGVSLLHSTLRCLAEAQQKLIMQQVLWDVCRWCDVAAVRGANTLLSDVLLCCVRNCNLDLLLMLTREFRVTWSKHIFPSTEPLLLAVAKRDMQMVSFLTVNGASTTLVGRLPKVREVRIQSLRKEGRNVSPLWLAAHLGDVAILQQLLQHTDAVCPDATVDTPAQCGDVLKALVEGAAWPTPKDIDMRMASAVAMLGRAGHACPSPAVLRHAVRKGMAETAEALLKCYGSTPLVDDIKCGGVHSLHYMASHSKFCGTLRSLLIAEHDTKMTAMGGGGSGSGSGNGGFKGVSLAQAILAMTFSVNPVDYALVHNCLEGALILIALGLYGSGAVSGKYGHALVGIMSLTARRRSTTKWHRYTVLHAAVELGHHALAEVIVREMVAIHGPNKGPLADLGEVDSSTPSYHALMVFHLSEVHYRALIYAGIPALEEVTTAIDIPYIVWSPHDSDRRCRAAIRETATKQGLEQPLDLLGGGIRREVVQHLVSCNPNAFFNGHRFAITVLTPMACAVTAGSLPWVQLLGSYGGSLTNDSSVIAGRHAPSTTARTWASAVVPPAGRGSKKDFKWRPIPRRHTCASTTDAWPINAYTHEKCNVSPLMLSIAITIEAVRSGAVDNMLSKQLQIIRYLLNCDEYPREEEINLLAIAAAELGLWDVLEAAATALVQRCMTFGAIATSDVPPFMRNTIGSARHVIHKAARCAPRDILLLIVRNSAFSHIEELCDAKGRTAFYHALNHPSSFALDVFTSLKLSTTKHCCTRTKRTPLMVACAFGKLAQVEKLMQKDFLELSDARGNTALILAAAAGHKQVVECLLGSGSLPSAKNSQGMTAAMVAAFAGHDGLAVPLVEKFSTLGDLFNRQTTILHCAAVGNAWGVTTTVLSQIEKADPLALDLFGNTAIYLAHAFGNMRVLRTLWGAVLHKNANVPSSLTRERRIFSRTSELVVHGWLKETLLLSEALLSAEQKGASRHTSTAKSGEALYGHRTSIRKCGVSLLLWCVQNSNTVGIRVLGNMNIGDSCGALHEAAKRGNVEVVKLLLKFEISQPDALDEAGMHPFEVAALHNHVACASLILLHTKLYPMRLQVTAKGDNHESQDSRASDTDAFHDTMRRVASAENAEILVEVVNTLQRMSGKSWPSVAQQLFEILVAPGPDEFTPLELHLASGRAAGALRLVRTLQRLSLEATGDRVFTITKFMVKRLWGLSPAVRVILYDMFDMTEVATTKGIRPRRPGRLSFADIRLIGINSLQRDAYCAAETATFFTLGHEVGVASALLEKFPLKMRFELCSFERRTVAERLKLLRWLGTSLILSSYEDLRGNAEVEEVELEVVSHPSDEFGNFASGRLHHSLYMDGSGQLVFPDLNSLLGFAGRKKKQLLLEDAEVLCDTITKTMWSLPHPSLSKGEVRVNWCNNSIDDVGQGAIECLISNGLKRVQAFFDGPMRDCLCGMKAEDILSVKSTSVEAVPGVSITFQYTREVLKKHRPLPMDMGSSVDGLSCVIRFSDEGMGGLDYVLHEVLYPRVLADANLVGVSHIRDAWSADVAHRVHQGKEGQTMSFKLQLEGGSLHTIPLHLLKIMMKNAVDAMAQLVAPARAAKPRYHASRIVCESITSSLCSVVALFSTTRDPIARQAQGNLLLRFNSSMVPTTHDICECLCRSALTEEAGRLKGVLAPLVSAAAKQLSTALPAVPLIMDVSTNLAERNIEDVVSCLSVLCHDRGALVLKPLIEGVSIGWKTDLGNIIRRHVRQISVVLATNEVTSCELQENGNFVYKCPLHCTKARSHRRWSLGLFSAQQIASLLLIHLNAVDPTLRKLISTTRSMACWSRACGMCTRVVNAGDQKCTIKITRRNILDQPVGRSSTDTLSFRGPWKSITVNNAGATVHFTAPTRTGYYRQHIFMNDQPLMNSPLHFRVRSLAPQLANTEVLSTFNTVVVKRPFRVALLLRDRYLNRVTFPYPVHVGAVDGGSVRVLSWKRACVDIVEVVAVVSEPGAGWMLPLRLTAGETDSHTVTFTVAAVTKAAYQLHIRSRFKSNQRNGFPSREAANRDRVVEQQNPQAIFPSPLRINKRKKVRVSSAA